MTRLVLVGCAAWMGLSISGVTAAPRLSVAVVRGFPGRTVEVALHLRYRTNDVHDVVAIQADVVFDRSGLDDQDAIVGAGLGVHRVGSARLTPGTRRVLFYSEANAALTHGELARVPFSVAPNDFRNFSLTLSNVILVRADATQVPGTVNHGGIAVSPVFLSSNGTADGFIEVGTNAVEQCYVVQATTDFVSWANVQTNSTEAGIVTFNDPDAAGQPHRFYRAILCDATGTLKLGSITQHPDGRVRFEFDGVDGRELVVQASTNLADWVNVQTNTGLGGSITFFDSITNLAQRFYRVRVGGY